MKTSQETAAPTSELVKYNDGWGEIAMSPEAAQAQEAIDAYNRKTSDKIQAIHGMTDASNDEKTIMVANARREADWALKSDAPLPGGTFGTDSTEQWRKVADARQISIADSLPGAVPTSETQQVTPQQQPSRTKRLFGRLSRK